MDRTQARAALPAARRDVPRPLPARCATPGAATKATWCRPSASCRMRARLRSSRRRRPTPSSPLLDRNWAAMRAQVHTAADYYEKHFGRRPARHLAGRVRLRPRRRRAAARGGDPLLLRRQHGILFADRPSASTMSTRPSIARRRGRLRARHGIVGAGLERKDWLPGRPALPRLLPRHRLRPAHRLHRPAHPPGRAPDVHGHSSTTPSPTTSCTTSGSTIPISRGARPACTPRTSAATGRSRSSGCAAGMDRPPIIVSPYDAELYGHWWYEGPIFLGDVFRQLHFDQSTASSRSRPGDYLDRHATNQVATPCASSWGAKGYYELLAATRPTPGPTATCTPPASAWSSWRAAPGAAPAHDVRALNQAARELMLAQSSDWTFIMTTGTTVPYATRRIQRAHRPLHQALRRAAEAPR